MTKEARMIAEIVPDQKATKQTKEFRSVLENPKGKSVSSGR
jgi:hypothetical protein